MQIRQKNSLRMKVQESHIKLCKNQVRDTKNMMINGLRDKVNELVEQEMDNKSNKLKMIASRKIVNDQESHLNSNSNMRKGSENINSCIL